MVTTAIIFLAIAALAGLYTLILILQDITTRKGVAFFHGIMAATGLILLIINAFVTDSDYKHIPSIVLFLLAAPGGAFLLYRDLTGKSISKWLGVAHGLLGLTGIVLVIWHALEEHAA